LPPQQQRRAPRGGAPPQLALPHPPLRALTGPNTTRAAPSPALPHWPLPSQFPYSGNATGGWTYTNARSWTSGFYPGFLWGLYNLTGRPEWRARAEKWTMGVANLQRDWSLQHDFGFVYMPSFGKMYEATASDFARRQVLAAAEAMAWSFNPATNSTRTFEGWDPRGATKKFRCGPAAVGMGRGHCREDRAASPWGQRRGGYAGVTDGGAAASAWLPQQQITNAS
jgi:hypothetical protein